MKWRPFLAMVTAAVLFAVYLWDVERTERGILEEFQELRLLFFEPSQVRRVAFGTGAEAVVVERLGGTGNPWRIVAPKEAPADDAVINGYLENLRGAKRHGRFVADDPGEYGLDAPQFTVAVTFAAEGGPETRTIEFGKQPGEFGRLYARLAEDPEDGFTVSEWVLRQSMKGFGDVRDRSLVPDDFPAAEQLTITNRRDDFEIQKVEATARWIVQTGQGVPLPADRSLLDRFFSTMGAANMIRVLDEPTSTTAQLGLDAPRAQLQAGGRLLLTVGAPIPRREQFIVETGDGTIGVIPGSMVADLFRSPTEWGTKRVVWIGREEIQQIETSSGSTRMMLMRTEDDGWIFPSMPSRPVRHDAVEEFLSNIKNLGTTRLVRGQLAVEDEERYGIVPEAFTLRVTGADGREQGATFGATDTREGFTYLLRLQDRSLWEVPLRLQGTVFRFVRDLEERRLVPGVVDHTDRLEMEISGNVLTFEKTPAAWRVRIPGQRPVLVPNQLMEGFLYGFEGLEVESEMISPARLPSQVTFRFYEAGDNKPFAETELLTRSQTTRKALFSVDGRQVEVSAEAFDAMDEAMASLLATAQMQAGQAPAN